MAGPGPGLSITLCSFCGRPAPAVVNQHPCPGLQVVVAAHLPSQCNAQQLVEYWLTHPPPIHRPPLPPFLYYKLLARRLVFLYIKDFISRNESPPRTYPDQNR